MVFLVEGGLGDPAQLQIHLHIRVLHVEEPNGFFKLLLRFVPGFHTLVHSPQILIHGDLTHAEDRILALQVHHIDPVVLSLHQQGVLFPLLALSPHDVASRTSVPEGLLAGIDDLLGILGFQNFANVADNALIGEADRIVGLRVRIQEDLG